MSMSEKTRPDADAPASQTSTIIPGEPEHATHLPQTIQPKHESSGANGQRKGPRSVLSDCQSVLFLRLENSGSVARDHLALERTFLAYVRTSLAIASAGIVIVQLFTVSAKTPSLSHAASRIQRFAPTLGATIIAFGIAVLLVGVMRFFTVQFALVKGKFPVARVVIVCVSVALSVLVATVFGLLVAGRQ